AKAGQVLGLRGGVAAQQLERDVTPKHDVLGLVDAAHPALAEQAEDLIAIADQRADPERRIRIGAILAAEPKRPGRSTAAVRGPPGLHRGPRKPRPADVGRGQLRALGQPRRRRGPRHAAHDTTGFFGRGRAAFGRAEIALQTRAVPKSSRKLDALAALLERTGGDPKRIEAVRRAQNFRRSWIELAEILCQVRARNLHEKWGYADFYAYAQDELTLKRATVDKLTISYSTLDRHAPQVLQRDGVATRIPDYDALEYYHRTVGELEAVTEADEEAANDDPERPRRRGRVPQIPSPELRQELEDAVFNEGQPLGELRRRFDQHFFPKPKGAEELDRIKRANATARKLAELLAEIDGLPEALVRKLEAELGKLRAQLDDLAEPIKDQVAKATARANKRALKARAELAEQLARGDEPEQAAAIEQPVEHDKAPKKRKRSAG